MHAALYEQALELAPSNNTTDTLYMLRANRELAQLRQRQGHTEQALESLQALKQRFESSRLTWHDEYALTLLAESVVLQTWVSSCGTNDGNNLADSDPLFITAVDPSSAPKLAGNLRLRVGSPVIDVGNNAFIPEGVTTDLDGNPRILGPSVDLGAFEGAVPDGIFQDRFAP